jgi:hypothetical protein
MITREELIKELRNSEVTVNFTKKDGTERSMLCTLLFEKVPTEKLPKGEYTTHDNGDTIRVYDLEKEDWRSFNYSTVTNVKVA